MERATFPTLVDRSVFLTGGASGIGAELVRSFAAQGAFVHFVDISDDDGTALVETLKDARHEPLYTHVDVRDEVALKNAVNATAEVFGHLDVLVNNVANDMRHKPLEVTAEYWRSCMAINLDSAFFASQAAIVLMQKTGGGSIVNFSSINAILGPTGMPGYVTAKAGLLGMTKALAKHYGKDKIRVNVILPGWVVTERQLEKWLTPEAEEEWSKLVAIKERILPEDVASLTLFLAAGDSDKITGQQFIIDAGRV